MRRQGKERHPQVQVGLSALAVFLCALLLAGRGSEPSQIPSVDLEQTASKAKRGPQGPVGKKGERGEKGPRGIEGERGPAGNKGPKGDDAFANVQRQFISIAWQNGQFDGRDRQSFVAPGIGEGNIQCTPPGSLAGDSGIMRIRFFPYDKGTDSTPENPEGTPPENWATTMWTMRAGGKDGPDAVDRSKTTVVRTARLDRGNQSSGFAESMNTAAVGYDPRSTGSFTGMITTEPFETSTTPPPPTSFQISWHWADFEYIQNTGQQSDARCYVSGVFVTEDS